MAAARRGLSAACRQPGEVAGGVLAGEASELERVLARLQHHVAIAAPISELTFLPSASDRPSA